MRRKRAPRGVAVSPEARRVLEHYDVPADELVASWMQEDDELLVLTRGERSVVVVFEDAGVLQLATPAELRKNASEEVK